MSNSINSPIQTQEPQVSVILPAYNCSGTLSESVQSVQAQTMSDWELLLVENGSSDNTYEIALDLAQKDSRIQVLQIPQKLGRPALPRRLAMNKAQGKYVAFIDADDLWLPPKLERQIKFMRENKAVFSFHAYRRFQGKQLGRLVEVPPEIDYQSLLKHNVVSCMTAMYDRHQIGDLVHPDCWRDDFAQWLDILKKGWKGHGLNEDLGRYRIGSSSISSNKFKAARRTWMMYRGHVKLSMAETLAVFVQYAVLATWKHLRF